jgi:hypothetical protein
MADVRFFIQQHFKGCETSSDIQLFLSVEIEKSLKEIRNE